MKFSLPMFRRHNALVGLDVGSSVVKAVQLSSKGRGNNFELTHLGVAPVPAEAIVQGAFLNAGAISAAIREAVDSAGITATEAAVAVSGNSVIVKRVHMPAMSAEELHEQISWEAEQHIPFDVNEVNIDFQILEPDAGDGQMEILLVAAKREGGSMVGREGRVAGGGGVRRRRRRRRRVRACGRGGGTCT